MRFFALILYLICTPFAAVSQELSLGERILLEALGPWPPSEITDASNQYIGQAEVIELGQALFFDPRLSASGNLSCASCHLPQHAFAEPQPRAQAGARLDRNTQSLINVGQMRWYNWDGRNDTLWGASIHPIINPEEMALTPEDVAALMRGDDQRNGFEAAFGTDVFEQPAMEQLVLVGKALAAFQETLISPSSRFDTYRAAVLAGTQSDALNAQEQRGLQLFLGEARCVLCHIGPSLSNSEFHDIGLPFFAEGKRVDQGRYGGIRAYQDNPFTRLGPFSDEPEAEQAKAPGNFVALQYRNWGEFRVPSLRGISQTAPYMHDGSKPDLDAVVRHYSDLNMDRLHADGESLLRPLDLEEADIAALVAFLNAL